MHLKMKAGVAVTMMSATFIWAACESNESSSPMVSFDSGPTPFDSGVTDAFVVDATIGDAHVGDASDASDAADAANVTSTPFATGLGATGVALEDGQVDPHWTVEDALGNAFASYAQTDALGYPNYWLAPSAASKFISPFTDTVDPSGNGTFTYTTTFVLGDEVDLASTQLTIRYASDNAMTDIALNGTSVGTVAAGSYSSFETIVVTAGFARGANSVSLTVTNSGGPTGMRAELDLVK